MISDVATQLRKDVSGAFQEALGVPAALMLVPSIATVLNSTSNKEDYSWLDEIADLEEFVDEVNFTAFTELTTPYEAINLTYTGGLELRRKDLEDDKVGGLRLRINDLARRAFMHDDVLLANVLNTNPTGLFAEALFSDTHTARGSGSTDNIIVGAGTSTAQIQTGLADALAMLYNMLDFAGNPTINRGYRQFAVVYPPDINKPILEAIRAGVVSQTSNVQFSEIGLNPIMEPLLTPTSAKDFYVAVMDAPVRGLLLQVREGPSMEVQESADSDIAFSKEIYRYKVRKRGVAKAGYWKRIVRVDVT